MIAEKKKTIHWRWNVFKTNNMLQVPEPTSNTISYYHSIPVLSTISHLHLANLHQWHDREQHQQQPKLETNLQQHQKQSSPSQQPLPLFLWEELWKLTLLILAQTKQYSNAPKSLKPNLTLRKKQQRSKRSTSANVAAGKCKRFLVNHSTKIWFLF